MGERWERGGKGAEMWERGGEGVEARAEAQERERRAQKGDSALCTLVASSLIVFGLRSPSYLLRLDRSVEAVEEICGEVRALVDVG